MNDIPTHHIFVDESGELGRAAGSSAFFLIAALCTPNLKALEKRIWKEKAKLYNDGWPNSVEIKGTTIWGADHIPGIPKKIYDRRLQILEDIIKSICASTCKIHYSIAQKKYLSDSIMNAEYGIAYNFLCGTLLCRAYKHFAGHLKITVDQRSKETHSKMKFDGYLETRLVSDCNHGHDLEIEHAESHDVLGLQAVDFISWGLFRKYQRKDDTYQKMIAPIVGYRDDWYSSKRSGPRKRALGYLNLGAATLDGAYLLKDAGQGITRRTGI
jgi:hypothetical protein